jgi:hypothetical protein
MFWTIAVGGETTISSSGSTLTNKTMTLAEYAAPIGGIVAQNSVSNSSGVTKTTPTVTIPADVTGALVVWAAMTPDGSTWSNGKYNGSTSNVNAVRNPINGTACSLQYLDILTGGSTGANNASSDSSAATDGLSAIAVFSAVTNLRTTRLAAEVWVPSTTALVVTRVAAEVWVPIERPNAIVTTYMGIEAWVSTTPTVPSITVNLTGVELLTEVGDFDIEISPPPSPTILPAYPYVQYNDDDDILAFFGAYNQYAQAYADWFNALHLPVYTSYPIADDLLDWVAKGLYGMARPAISSSAGEFIGPLATFSGAEMGFAYDLFIGEEDLQVVDDDVFRRILTWHIQKSMGKVFNVRWLKRRIIQFLNGLNGVPFNVDQTYDVSVTFGPGNQVNINFSFGTWSDEDGIYPGWAGMAEYAYAQETATFTPNTPIDGALLKAAIQSGVLELPFQFTYVVNL